MGEELARELGVSGAEIQEALAASGSMSPDSLDVPDSDGTGGFLAQWLAVNDSEPERLDELLALGQALRQLSAADRALLYHRYVGEETQTALGQRFGMAQMQVSRRLARILVQLQRSLLNPEQDASAATGCGPFQGIQRRIP
jgi:RNA polymerase sigma-B factor